VAQPPPSPTALAAGASPRGFPSLCRATPSRRMSRRRMLPPRPRHGWIPAAKPWTWRRYRPGVSPACCLPERARGTPGLLLPAVSAGFVLTPGVGGVLGGSRADLAAPALSPSAGGIARVLLPRRGHAGKLLRQRRGRRWLFPRAAVPSEWDVLPSHTLLALFIYFLGCFIYYFCFFPLD